jgi:hypothetical protein
MWEKILELIRKESQPLYHSLKESETALKGKIVDIRYKGTLDLTDRKIQILNSKVREIMGAEYSARIIKDEVVPEPAKKEELKPKRRVLTPMQIEEEEPVVGEIVNIFGGRVEKKD